jgi:hypothetical protein
MSAHGFTHVLAYFVCINKRLGNVRSSIVRKCCASWLSAKSGIFVIKKCKASCILCETCRAKCKSL